MNGNMTLGKRVTALEKDGGAEIKKEISDLQNGLTAAQGEISNLENKVNNFHSYSNEEKVVGTWIDGKQLFQKTFSFQLGNYTELHTYDVSPNIQSDYDIKTSSGMVKFTSGNVCMLPYYQPKNSAAGISITAIIKNSTTVQVDTGQVSRNGVEIELTIQYTKTTQ